MRDVPRGTIEKRPNESFSSAILTLGYAKNAVQGILVKISHFLTENLKTLRKFR